MMSIRTLTKTMSHDSTSRYSFIVVGCLSGLLGGVALPQTLPPSAPRTVSYAEDVHPILAEYCYKCHAGEKKEGGLQLDSREAVLAGGMFGPVVDLDNSADSYLVQVVAGMDPELSMPKEGRQLTPEEIGILRAWIDQGLPWEAVEPETPDWEAPIRPRDVAVPAGSGIHDSEHPIDRFLAEYFQEHSLDPPAIADDRTFARRAFLDAIGLLPTQDELHVFLNDDRPHDRDRLIQDLIRRDVHYAEHWMTFWNDALRNDFQGTGYIDGGRKQITDWLYQALYDNRPFDQFVRDLIAPTEESEGFINGIIWRGVTAANQQPPMQAARSVSQVFLGVNLKCASCHDSFVDDWTLAEAYGMAQWFADGPLELVRCDVPTGRTAEAQFLWPELATVAGDDLPEQKLERLARLVTMPDNGRFARTIVNRVWEQLMGRGLVEPLDTMANEPWAPNLLDWIAQSFVLSGYDLRHLLRTIMTSKTYQLQSDRAEHEDTAYVFRGPLPKRMEAEEFLDAIARVTATWQNDPKFTHATLSNEEIRAWRVPADALTRALGRPNREQVVTRRESAYTTLQALEMTNGETLARQLERGAANLLAEDYGSVDSLVITVYERGLQRLPTAAELTVAREAFLTPLTAAGLEDFLWSLIMLPEFQIIY